MTDPNLKQDVSAGEKAALAAVNSEVSWFKANKAWLAAVLVALVIGLVLGRVL